MDSREEFLNGMKERLKWNGGHGLFWNNGMEWKEGTAPEMEIRETEWNTDKTPQVFFFH